VRRLLPVLVAFGMAVPAWGATAGPAMAQALRAPDARVGSTSSNWSGYAAFRSGTTFTDVKGSWVQPSVSCPTSKKTYSSFWIGIDGYNSSSVEQTGTEADCKGVNRPAYYAWYEMYPSPSARITGFAVHPGDTLSAEVSVSGSQFTLTLNNLTTGAHFSTTKSSSSAAKSSAEWVAEAPTICSFTCHLAKLSNFGTVNFSGSFATGNGHTGSINDSQWSNDAITMKSGATTKAQPSALSPDGTVFSITWKHV
jgi:peptidase A4-like protein